MKIKFLFPFLLLLSTFMFAQKTNTINQHNHLANYGYDVVSYFSGKPEQGSSKFSVLYEGVNYYFLNAQNKTKFQQSPTQYLPQYGGFCAFAMGDSGEKIDVNPKTYKITNGKLYLFYDKFFKNTLTSWNKDEKNLTVKADRNWKKLTEK